ncbi:hypothetical protein GN958_ATG09310 [Phytophthora infestans]|uniref:Uncharacterized protein n=1 Tax=Phytophthora infestans TaxID=4787 RepID=A0A8S9UQ42_PHYIN|nr:hypothetical protein GN958_ATG09310 [Phytophthora infestans]
MAFLPTRSKLYQARKATETANCALTTAGGRGAPYLARMLSNDEVVHRPRRFEAKLMSLTRAGRTFQCRFCLAGKRCGLPFLA